MLCREMIDATYGSQPQQAPGPSPEPTTEGGALGGRSHLLGYQWFANICRTKRCISNPRVSFRMPLSGQASRRGLRRRVRSECAHRSFDHRDDFDLGFAVVRLTPRALDYDDHLLGWIDEDELAKGASRRKGTVVDAARQRRHRPPVVAVSRRRTGHEPAEGSGRAVGLSGEIAPAGRQDPSATERFAVLQHQLAEAAKVAQARADAKPAQLQAAFGVELPIPVGLHAGGSPDRLSAIVCQGPARSGRDQRANQAALAGRIVKDDALRLSARQFAQ